MSAPRAPGPFVRVRFLPSGRSIRVARGAHLSLAAVRAGVAIVHDCDGQGVCGTCRVHVQSGADKLSAVEPIERRQLGADAGGGWRLCCRARAFGDVVVRIDERGFAYPPELQR